MIDEDPNWDNDPSNPGESEDSAEVRPKKKQLVIREYKPKKEPVNVIFCGHVDAGKSTIGGQIMLDFTFFFFFFLLKLYFFVKGF